MFSDEIAIDLGTANTLVYNKSQGLLYNAPSYVAQNTENKKIVALGSQAKEMVGRTNPLIMTSRPLLDGVISEYECVLPMMKEVLRRTSPPLKRKLTISVPNGVSDIEMRAVVDLGYQLGYRKLEIVDEPLMAALGEGLDINQSYGRMIVDIGAGTTDIAVISLGSIVVGESIKIASDDFDDAIIKMIQDKYRLKIGKLTAERIKMIYAEKIKGLMEHCQESDDSFIEVSGLHIIKGIPGIIEVELREIRECICPLENMLIEAIQGVLSRTKPELLSDIMEEGILITGGGSLIPHVAKQIEIACELPVRQSDFPLDSVGKGLELKIKGYPVKPKYA